MRLQDTFHMVKLKKNPFSNDGHFSVSLKNKKQWKRKGITGPDKTKYVFARSTYVLFLFLFIR